MRAMTKPDSGARAPLEDIIPRIAGQGKEVKQV